MFNHAALPQELFLLKDVDIYPFLSTLGSLPKLLTLYCTHPSLSGGSWFCSQGKVKTVNWSFISKLSETEMKGFFLFALNKKRCLGVVLLNK